jgi:hypothetical protein
MGYKYMSMFNTITNILDSDPDISQNHAMFVDRLVILFWPIDKQKNWTLTGDMLQQTSDTYQNTGDTKKTSATLKNTYDTT